jgi:hypothetical protein
VALRPQLVRVSRVDDDAGCIVLTHVPFGLAVTTVEFTFMQGDLPPMTVVSNALTLTASTAVISVTDNAVKGTKANLECSARGVCGELSLAAVVVVVVVHQVVISPTFVSTDRSTGVCSCFSSFLSSDGDGNFGRRGDCGYLSPYSGTAVA